MLRSLPASHDPESAQFKRWNVYIRFMRLEHQSDKSLEQLARDVRHERLRRRGNIHRCVACGQEFVARRGARTCSTTCRVRALRARATANQRENRMIGVGYESLAVEDLISRLRSEGVDVVVDVRLNAISRKRGYSKRALQSALTDAGIRYLHDRRLGNPRENRPGYAQTNSPAGAEARSRFRERLGSTDGAQAIAELADLITTHTVAVLCFEADEQHCHREQVIAAVREAPQSFALV